MIKIFNTFLFISLSMLLPAQSIEGVYDYPIKPGTKEWYELKTEEERFDVLQIPDDLLKSMSTENLIITCINFPAFGHFTAYNNPQQGMNYLIESFNGLQELLNRKDAPAKLLCIYSGMDTIEMFIPNKEVNKELWTIRRCYFEFLLTQDGILDKMNSENRLKLLKEARKKLNYKADNKHKYSFLSFQATMLIMAKALDRSEDSVFKSVKKQNAEIKQFFENSYTMTSSVINLLIMMCDNYIYTQNSEL